VRREDDHVVRPIQQPLEALIKRRRVPFDIGVLDAGLDAEFDPADALVEKGVAGEQGRPVDAEGDAAFTVSGRVDDLDGETANRPIWPSTTGVASRASASFGWRK